MFHSGKTLYIFDRESGVRLNKKHESGSFNCIFYNQEKDWFHWMDCACYSFNYRFKIEDYDAKS